MLIGIFRILIFLFLVGILSYYSIWNFLLFLGRDVLYSHRNFSLFLTLIFLNIIRVNSKNSLYNRGHGMAVLFLFHEPNLDFIRTNFFAKIPHFQQNTIFPQKPQLTILNSICTLLMSSILRIIILASSKSY